MTENQYTNRWKKKKKTLYGTAEVWRYLIHSIDRVVFPPMTQKHKPALLHTVTSLEVPAHVVSKSLVVKQTLDAANSADSNVLIPQLLIGKLHDVLLGDAVDCSLDLTGAHATTGGDDLPANIFGNSGSAVEGQKYRGLELSLGTLSLGLCHTLGKARPLAEGEVNQIVETGQFVGNKVDTPETMTD